MSCELEGIFDPSQVAPTMGGSQNLPVSTNEGHPVVITGADWKQTQSGAGEMLQLQLEVIDGIHRGNTGTWNLNLKNANMTAVRIAIQELSCICHAVGHLSPLKAVDVLFNKPFRVVVGLQKGAEAAEKGYTEIKQVLRIDGSKLNKPAQATQQPAPVQQFAPQPQPQQFAPPVQQSAPVQQFAPPVQQGVVPPVQQGVAPPVQQFAPQPQPQQFAPPVQQSAPVQQGQQLPPWAQQPNQGG
jgi:hypothetical protein